MGNSRSSFSQSFSSTFGTKNFRGTISPPSDEYDGEGEEKTSFRNRRRTPVVKGKNRSRRRSVSVEFRGRRRMSSVIHENLVKINLDRSIRDVYSGVDSTSNHLGEGTWGTVKLVRRRSNIKHKAAVKILKLSKDIKSSRMKELRQEISLLQQIDHPHIAKLYETYEEEGCNLYLVMEYLSGGELFDRVINLGHFREIKAAEAVQQMVGAVQYLHAKGIVHRDLKLENFMYRSKNSDKLVLIDFGLSTKYADPQATNLKGSKKKKYLNEMVGSSYYMAPEVMKRKYGRECDMWSLGVIAYMLLSGHPPFAGDTDEEIMKRVRKGKYHFDHSAFKKISENAVDFCRKLLQYDTKNRMTAQQALVHPWLSEHSKRMMQRRSQRRGSVLDLEVVNNLRGFVETNRFKKLALQAVAYSTRYEDIAHLQTLFEDIDEDKDGYITFEEFKKALKDHPNVSPALAKKIFNAMDVDNTQKVHLNEFIAATMNKNLMEDERILREAFRKLDINDTGEIDIIDLKAVLGQNFSAEAISRMFKEFAGGNSKTMTKLNMEQFIVAMRRARTKEGQSYMSLKRKGKDDPDSDTETDLSDYDVPI